MFSQSLSVMSCHLLTEREREKGTEHTDKYYRWDHISYYMMLIAHTHNWEKEKGVISIVERLLTSFVENVLAMIDSTWRDFSISREKCRRWRNWGQINCETVSTLWLLGGVLVMQKVLWLVSEKNPFTNVWNNTQQWKHIDIDHCLGIFHVLISDYIRTWQGRHVWFRHNRFGCWIFNTIKNLTCDLK
jgi:hypothetical protein